MTTVKISPKAIQILERLQLYYQKPKNVLIDLALKKYEDQLLLEEINKAYANLKADQKAWKEELKDRKELERTIGDGLEKK